MKKDNKHFEKFTKFMHSIEQRNPGQPEFIQAVHEVAETVFPFIKEHSRYNNRKILSRITEPERVIMFRVCWVDDKERVQVNRGYRVQMNSAIGPYKGGLRFHPSVNLSILKFLAFEQTFKNSLTTLPLGAGKGGADFDPKGKSDNEIMNFCQSFMTELAKYIGQYRDVPAGDIGVGSREIGYMYGQYKRITSEFTGVLTGKDTLFGGSLIRPEATGYGTVYFAEATLKVKDDGLKDKVCVVSGSGNVAQYATEKLIQLGAKVVTLSDSSGFIYDKNGIDEEKLDFVKDLKNNKRGRIKEYAEKFDAEYHEGKKPWNVKCDLAFPSATQNEINEDDAKALVGNGVIGIYEGANMPTTAAGTEVFRENKIIYSPGKAANAGGVATSGLEMSQNAQRLYWEREEVDSKLQNIMKNIHDKCVKYGKDPDSDHVDYVKGANIAGFVKVADAMLAQGVV
ncbi:MAG: NADP-specific glutamate dehydrogenase [Bacteroidota bacterium]